MNDFFDNIDNGINEFGDDSTNQIMELIETLPKKVDNVEISKDAVEDEQANQVTNIALENLKNTAQMTEIASREVFILARSSDSPRAWEVLSAILKTNIDAAKTMHDIIEKKASTNAPKGGDGPQGVSVTQNNFYGTAEDVMQALKNSDDVIEAEVIEDE